MKKLGVILLAIAFMSSLSLAQQKKLGWSMGYFTTWDNSYTPANLPWDAFTAVAYFQTKPNTDGTLAVPSDAVAQQLISEGHKRGKKVLYCVGGQGVTTFKAACANGIRGKFISSMISYLKRLGFDGIDTDWEEDFDNTLFQAWHKDLRDSINKLTPVPMLTIAAEDWGGAEVTLTVSAYVDQVNDMYYSASANKYLTDIFPRMMKAGVPKSKCGAGMGVSMSDTVKQVVDICNMVINNGYGGVIQWAISKNGLGAANMAAIAAYVPVATGIAVNRDIRNDSPVSLFFKSNGMTGMNEISYSIVNNNSIVDLCVYDIKGALVRTLIHGPVNQGVFSVPFAKVSAGAYVAKLSTDSKVQAAKTFVIK
jgi:GH18 family chitinase